MKICAWDIGIKHLAYCIIEKNTNTQPTVINWETIDLTNENKFFCFLNKKCMKKTLYKYVKNNVTHGLCKTHHKELKNGITNCYKKLNEKYKCVGDNEQNCNNKPSFSFNNNIHLCTKHKKEHMDNIINKLNIEKNIDMSFMELCIKLYSELEKRKELLLNVNEIIIENQPSYMNPTMKSISMLLYGYFVQKIISEKSMIKNVKFESPMNKLKLNEISDSEQFEQIKNIIINDKKTKNITDGSPNNDDENNILTYKMTKQLSVEYCKTLLKNDNKWLSFLESYKKKDDLSDCFLFAYKYIQKML